MDIQKFCFSFFSTKAYVIRQIFIIYAGYEHFLPLYMYPFLKGATLKGNIVNSICSQRCHSNEFDVVKICKKGVLVSYSGTYVLDVC